MVDSDTPEPTTMHLLKPAKSRFDSLKRQVEADRDEQMNNTDVLALLMDEYEGED